MNHPCSSQKQFIPGPCGHLEVIMSCPETATSDVFPYAVICHPHPLYGGTMDNKVVYVVADTFNRLGAGAVRFNFRGVGNSAGRFDHGKGETEDLLAVIHWLNTEYAISELWLAGYSFGSYIALQAYHQVNADRLLLVAPALEHFDDELQLKETPTLVIQGSHDEVVLPEVVAEWTTSQQHQPQVQWINEADHFFHGKLNDLREAMMQEW